MIIGLLVTFLKGEGHTLLLRDGKGITDAVIIRFKAEHTAHQCTVRAVAAIGLGKGTKKLEMDVHDFSLGHQPCDVGDLERACRMGAGRADHDRADDIKYADLSHRYFLSAVYCRIPLSSVFIR